MSYVNLECMARGVSVISSDVGAVNMSVNEDNGWLVEPARVDVLVRAMEEALDISEDKLMARKVKARADVSKKFIWEDIITEVIKELVN
jgi:glycosyltransferase involved in cell wall biosynthesis